MSFPVDFGTIPANAQGTTQLADATDDHSLAHRQIGTMLNAMGTKLGLSSGTPGNNQILVGAALGTAAWGTVWNGGDIGSATLGTPTLTLGADASGDMFFRSAGGTVNRLAIGANNTFLTTNGTTPSWAASPLNFTSSGTTATGTTASATYVDVTGGSITITPTKTVTVQAVASGRIYGNAISQITPQLLINGTAIQTYDTGVISGQTNQGIPFSLTGQASVAAGTITIKLQFKTTAGTMSIEPNLSAIWG